MEEMERKGPNSPNWRLCLHLSVPLSRSRLPRMRDGISPATVSMHPVLHGDVTQVSGESVRL